MFNIFLVDDDELLANSLSQLLGDFPRIEVAKRASSEGEAIDWLIQNQTLWDLSVVDLALGDGSGLRVLSACRVRQPHQKMVVLSNHLNAEMRRRCRALGADAAFDKTTDIEALLNYCVEESQVAVRRNPG